jgi:pyridoxamine 5'-phosphate oxidase
VFEESRARVEADPSLAPDDWGLYLVRPVEAEFWQGSPDRRHVRLRYLREKPEGPWERGLLWP